MLADTLYRFAGDNKPFIVKLVFDKEVADSVLEREWHPNQKTKLLKNGKAELEFTAKGDVEVKCWIMAWGRYCTVKSPQWVKEMITEEINAMAL
jgi:predicted DNA-binding transcriptional regulator YafY